MASKKQLAWRKKFAKMAKAGKFKKSKKKTTGIKASLREREYLENYGYTKAEIKKIEAINKRHMERGHLEHGDSQKRYLISDKYYKNLVAESKERNAESNQGNERTRPDTGDW